MSKFKTEAISFAQSFGSALVTALIIAASVLPEGTLTNPDFYKTGGALALLFSAVRVAFKTVWKKTLPESVGGNPK